MKSTKKLLSLFIVFSLFASLVIPVNAKAATMKTDQDKLERIVYEINMAVAEESKNINAFENNQISFDVMVDGKKEATVTIETEKIDNDGDIHPNWVGVVSDGSWVHTITYDIGINGEVVLKTYYTVSGGAIQVNPTNTDSSSSPPLGYTANTPTDYYTKYSSTQFSSYGSYTFIMAVTNLPLTYNITQSFGLYPGGDSSGNNFVISSEITL